MANRHLNHKYYCQNPADDIKAYNMLFQEGVLFEIRSRHLR